MGLADLTDPTELFDLLDLLDLTDPTDLLDLLDLLALPGLLDPARRGGGLPPSPIPVRSNRSSRLRPLYFSFYPLNVMLSDDFRMKLETSLFPTFIL